MRNKKGNSKNLSKIKLSKKEIAMLNESSFFIEKQIVSKKIQILLNEVKNEIITTPEFLKTDFPKGTDITAGKISKGENYRQLPYMILDFPKLFKDREIFAFRTMVWWGNFISCTLLISGDNLKLTRKNFLIHQHFLMKHKVRLCISETPWQHHFEKDNYRKLRNIKPEEAEEIFSKQSFLKVARKLSINKIKEIDSFARESFIIFSKLLAE